LKFVAQAGSRGQSSGILSYGLANSALAWLYDLVQRLAGLEEVRRHLAPHLSRLHGRVIDIGAGTGLYASLVPFESYLGVDVEEEKLLRLQARVPGAVTVLADATALPVEDSSFDNGICINVCHHLSDADLDRVVAELARVVSGTVVFVDPVLTDRAWSRALWSIDRGAYPRKANTVLDALRSAFVLDHTEEFRVRHTYVLAVARRRDHEQRLH